MDYQFSYLIGDLFLLSLWAALFFWRKDVRKEMLLVSLTFGFAGLIAGLVYTVDWWHPLTITLTRVGIEDFLLGFSLAGVAAVIYEDFFKKRVRIRKVSKKVEFMDNRQFFITFIGLSLFFFVSFYFLNLHSFYLSIIVFGVPTLFIWIARKDLIIDSLASGFLLVLVSLVGFIIIEFITPEWVESAWYFKNLSGITFLTVPLEDIIWFFLVGAFIGPLYEYWKEGKLVKSGK